MTCSFFFKHRKVLIICNFFLLFHAFAAYFCEKICIKFDDAKKFQWMLKNPTVKINLAAHLTLSCFDSFIMLDPQCSKICKKVKFKKIVSIFFDFPNSPHWNFFFINLVYLIKPCSYKFFISLFNIPNYRALCRKRGGVDVHFRIGKFLIF